LDIPLIEVAGFGAIALAITAHEKEAPSGPVEDDAAAGGDALYGLGMCVICRARAAKRDARPFDLGKRVGSMLTACTLYEAVTGAATGEGYPSAPTLGRAKYLFVQGAASASLRCRRGQRLSEQADRNKAAFR
jgi:hypothetical protein